jgi:Tol biopolymer transport system component
VVQPDAAARPREPIPGLNPAWSPDGQWLVYQITRDHTHEAGDARAHTPDTMPHAHLDKENHRIVDSELWIVGADSNGRQQLTATPDVLESDPDWSPDGTAIVCRTEETGRIRVLKLNRP